MKSFFGYQLDEVVNESTIVLPPAVFQWEKIKRFADPLLYPIIVHGVYKNAYLQIENAERACALIKEYHRNNAIEQFVLASFTRTPDGMLVNEREPQIYHSMGNEQFTRRAYPHPLDDIRSVILSIATHISDTYALKYKYEPSTRIL